MLVVVVVVVVLLTLLFVVQLTIKLVDIKSLEKKFLTAMKIILNNKKEVSM